MEGPGLGFRGREASLVQPTCICEGDQGGESLPVWGFPVHQKGLYGPLAPRWGAHSIRRQVQCRPRSAPCKRGAASFGCYGPSLRPFHWEGLCRIKRGYIGCDGPSIRRACAGVSPGCLPSPGCQGRDTGPDGDEEMATFACAAGPVYGPLGWAWALSPRVGLVGFPGLWFLLWV